MKVLDIQVNQAHFIQTVVCFPKPSPLSVNLRDFVRDLFTIDYNVAFG